MREAQDDIEAIYEYIASEGGVRAADRLIDSITALCDDLAQLPRMGTRRPEMDDFGHEVRGITHRGYLILYAEHGGVLHIVRVLHGSRQYRFEDIGGMINIP